MWYLISQLAPFLLLALVIGIVVGWLTSSRAVATDGETTDLIRSENRSGTTFLLILLVAAIIGVLIAVFHFFRGVPGFWWDAIMLLLAAYFIGCVLGCLIRRWFGGFDAMAPATATAALMVTPRLRDPLPGPAPAPAVPVPAARPEPSPAAPVPAPVAAPAPALQPEAPRPAPPAPFPTAPVVWSAPAGADAPAPAPAPAPVPAAPAPVAPAPAVPAPAVAPAAYAWGAAYDGARMTLTGTVPSETTRTDLASAVRAAFPVAQIRDETTIRADAPAAFAGLAGIGVAQLGRMVRGSVSIRDTVMSVEGTARTAADRDAVKAALAGLPAGTRLAFERVGVAAPVEAPAPAAPPPPAPPAAAPEPAPAAAPAPAPVVAFDDDDESIVATRPEGLAAPRDGRKDDLKRIKGIGRVNEAKLNELGIFHFSQIAAWRAEQAKWVNSHLSFPGRIQRESWIAQAHVLAAGGVTEFASRVDRGELDYRPGGANDYSSTGPNRT